MEYRVLLTWRVTLYERVLSVSQATGQRAIAAAKLIMIIIMCV